VALVRATIADAVAADEVAQAVREELAREGALDGGDGYPRVEIEVLRADETSAALVAPPAGAAAPTARATIIAVMARGWVVTEPGGPAERDSGDLRAEVPIAVDEGVAGPDARASLFHATDAMRAAARRVGQQIGRRMLGIMPGVREAEPERL
jgi:hypothetical protein